MSYKEAFQEKGEKTQRNGKPRPMMIPKKIHQKMRNHQVKWNSTSDMEDAATWWTNIILLSHKKNPTGPKDTRTDVRKRIQTVKWTCSMKRNQKKENSNVSFGRDWLRNSHRFPKWFHCIVRYQHLYEINKLRNKN